MRKILLTYTSFVIACVVVIVAFITATNYTQLTVAILLYPVLVFFAYKVFPRKAHSKKPVSVMEPFKSEEVGETKRQYVGIADIDKRLFLKLIGGTGLFLFLFSFFNKKTENIFFKNLPGQNKVSLTDVDGKKISPAQRSPLDGYNIAEIEDSTISFYGFVNKDGAWYVLRVDTVAGSFRYARGDTDFPGAWKNRENLNYDYYHNVFY